MLLILLSLVIALLLAAVITFALAQLERWYDDRDRKRRRKYWR